MRLVLRPGSGDWATPRAHLRTLRSGAVGVGRRNVRARPGGRGKKKRVGLDSSTFYDTGLGGLDDRALELLRQWAAENCVAHMLVKSINSTKSDKIEQN